VSEAASVVIPSTAFFSKEWPRKELDALVARDDGNAKVILPIWHRLSAEDVRRKSPLLADKVAIRNTDDIQMVADGIYRAIAEGSPSCRLPAPRDFTAALEDA
jgi:hypothetical protein